MKRKILHSICLIAIYFGVLIGLKYLDILNRFYSSGLPVIVYILKTIFTFYFLTILLTAGASIAAGSFA